jgi:hypothetical protein
LLPLGPHANLNVLDIRVAIKRCAFERRHRQLMT